MANILKGIDITEVGKSSSLTERKKTKSLLSEGTKSKNLPAMPAAYFEAHKELKLSGGTAAPFTQYIYEAVREKLKRDGAL